MMTVITRVALVEGSEPEWDAIMRGRLNAARDQRGWLGGQLLIPLDTLDKRTIVGTRETRADWEAWHEDAAFKQTADRLDELQVEQQETTWHEVIVEVRAPERRKPRNKCRQPAQPAAHGLLGAGHRRRGRHSGRMHGHASANDDC